MSSYHRELLFEVVVLLGGFVVFGADMVLPRGADDVVFVLKDCNWLDVLQDFALTRTFIYSLRDLPEIKYS